jgi:fumarylacetoacetase
MLLTLVNGDEELLCEAISDNLLYNFPQMIAHHTSTGCPMRCGDLLGSGTISGEGSRAMGSLLEASENGKTPIDSELGLRDFLRDGDTVVMRGSTKGEHGLVGFGDCAGMILPAS